MGYYCKKHKTYHPGGVIYNTSHGEDITDDALELLAEGKDLENIYPGYRTHKSDPFFKTWCYLCNIKLLEELWGGWGLTHLIILLTFSKGVFVSANFIPGAGDPFDRYGCRFWPFGTENQIGFSSTGEWMSGFAASYDITEFVIYAFVFPFCLIWLMRQMTKRTLGIITFRLLSFIGTLLLATLVVLLCALPVFIILLLCIKGLSIISPLFLACFDSMNEIMAIPGTVIISILITALVSPKNREHWFDLWETSVDLIVGFSRYVNSLFNH